jgi:CheY-like chemotaxis protein
MDTNKRILLVEDDPNDIELTLNTIGEYNLANNIDVTRDGVEALDYIYKRGAFASRSGDNPVLILLDLKMPRMDGVEVLRKLKSDEKTRIVPVVILTSSREDRDLAECYKIGVNAYVVKPVHFSEFMEAVRQLGVFWLLINEPPPVKRK